VLDECWSLLDSPVLAPEVVQLFRTARKRNSSVWGISQTLEDFVGTSMQPRPHGPGIVKNANTKLIGQQPGDMSVLETNSTLMKLHSPRSSDSPRHKRAVTRDVCWSSGRSRRRPKPCDWFRPYRLLDL